MDAKITFVGDGNTSNLTSLSRVIQHKLVIPSYQRPYAWSESNVEDLFRTIQEASFEEVMRFENSKTKQSISTGGFTERIDNSSRRDVFFGSIILSKTVKGNDEVYKIIDGQQRITTFLLILRVIAELLDIECKEIIKKLEDLDQQVESSKNEGDIKKHGDLQKNIFIQEQDSDTCQKMTDKINNQLGIKIKREKYDLAIEKYEQGVQSEDESNIQDDSEYIQYISKGVKGRSADFKKSYEKIKNSIREMALDMELKQDSEKEVKPYEKYEAVANLILRGVKFCLLEVSGPDSETYAIDIFNTLNSTGEPLTAFEVLKSKLMQLYPSETKNVERYFEDIEKHIKQHKKKRLDLTSQTGKLILHLALYRSDYNGLKLSDKDFQAQYRYIKRILSPVLNPTPSPMANKKNNFKDYKAIIHPMSELNQFVVNNWIRTNKEYASIKGISTLALKGFDFLKAINHNRVMPIIFRFCKQNLKGDFSLENYSKIIEICTSFSVLWRMAYHGKAARIDTAYQKIAREIAIKSKGSAFVPLNDVTSVFAHIFETEFDTFKEWSGMVLDSRLVMAPKIAQFILALDGLKKFESYTFSEWELVQLQGAGADSPSSLGNAVISLKSDHKKINDHRKHLENLTKSPLFKSHVFQKIDVHNLTSAYIKKRTESLARRIWEQLANQHLDLEG